MKLPQKPPALTTMGTFADVLAQLGAADLTGLAPKLASMGIRDMDQLNGMTPEQIMGVATTYQELERLCHLLDRPIPRRPTPRSPYQRTDLPTVGAATRGSITGAMAAAHPEAREEALRNLHRDQYANNTRNTRDLRWNLWTKLVTCHPHPGPTQPHWIDDTYDCTLATIVCCWWMLRGIEVAAAKWEHLWFETTPFGRMAFFTLEDVHVFDLASVAVLGSVWCPV